MKKRKTNKKTCNMYAMNRLMPNKNISTVKHLCLIVSFTIFLEELKDKWFRKEVKW